MKTGIYTTLLRVMLTGAAAMVCLHGTAQTEAMATAPSALSDIGRTTVSDTHCAATTDSLSTRPIAPLAGVTLIAGALLARGEDAHFGRLHSSYYAESHSHLADGLQYLPGLVMVGLKTAGIESRSSWGRMAASGALSAVAMAAATEGLKRTAHMRRPDGTDNHSMPSGHTAIAFMTATMLTHEYGHHSPWVGVGAYTAATATGLMRISEHRHWVSDVLMGAGIGILSAQLGYWVTDRLMGSRGLSHSTATSPALPDAYDRPSMVSLYVGVSVPIGSYAIDGQHLWRQSAGTTVGAEGAYFLTPYLGIGGRIAALRASVITDGTQAEDDTFDALMAHGGAYLSYPIAPRWQVGTKALMGYAYYPHIQLCGQQLSSHGGLSIGSGLSVAYRANSRSSLRLFADYTLLPPRNGGQYMHTVATGMALAVNL